MAKVSLDGIRIEVPHAQTPEAVEGRLEEFAQDLAQNKFQEWGMQIVRQDEGLTLTGRREGTHFDAVVRARSDAAVIALRGAIELSRVKLTLAGGAEGVRRRVVSAIETTLREHLAP